MPMTLRSLLIVRGSWAALAVACVTSGAAIYQIYGSACAQDYMLNRTLAALTSVAARDLARELAAEPAPAVASDVAAALTRAQRRAASLPFLTRGRDVSVDSAFLVSVRARDGSEVVRAENESLLGDRELGARRTLQLSAGFSGYALVVTPRPWLTGDFGDGLWTWPRAQLAIIMITAAVLVLIAVTYHFHRERAAARLRENFVASVSHELRTPLAQIRMFAELLRLDWVRSPDERERSVRIIDQEARRLTDLVENVLHYSAAQRPRATLGVEPVHLAAVVDDVCEAFGPATAESQTDLVIHVDPGLVVLGDRDALRQVLVNLLDNAVKYGARGGVVTVVAARRSAAQITLVVDDEGRGVSPRERHRIFEPFVRGSTAAQFAGGSGIGLAVVRDLVNRMAGTVHVEDAPEGGARFIVVLPAAPVVHAHQVRSGAQDAYSGVT